MKTIIPSARYFLMLLSFAALLTACAAKPTGIVHIPDSDDYDK